jgi:hypothetical protein
MTTLEAQQRSGWAHSHTLTLNSSRNRKEQAITVVDTCQPGRLSTLWPTYAHTIMQAAATMLAPRSKWDSHSISTHSFLVMCLFCKSDNLGTHYSRVVSVSDHLQAV